MAYQIGDINTPTGLSVDEHVEWIAVRHAFITGLHQLADWLAEHPEAPIRSYGSLVEEDVAVFGCTKAQLAALTDAVGEELTKIVGASNFELTRRFSGGVRYSANATRTEVSSSCVDPVFDCVDDDDA